MAYSYNGIDWSASSGGSLITYAYTIASRRVLPFIGTSSNHFQAGPSGPTGPAAVGDYFINTASKNLYSYGPTAW